MRLAVVHLNSIAYALMINTVTHVVPAANKVALVYTKVETNNYELSRGVLTTTFGESARVDGVIEYVLQLDFALKRDGKMYTAQYDTDQIRKEIRNQCWISDLPKCLKRVDTIVPLDRQCVVCFANDDEFSFRPRLPFILNETMSSESEQEQRHKKVIKSYEARIDRLTAAAREHAHEKAQLLDRQANLEYIIAGLHTGDEIKLEGKLDLKRARVE